MRVCLQPISAINARRTDLSYFGAIGRDDLPKTDKEGGRRMILALCGQPDDYDSSGYRQCVSFAALGLC